jgi:hypothetical protein
MYKMFLVHRQKHVILSVLCVLLIFSISSAAIITSSISSRKLSVGDLLNFSVHLIVKKGTSVTPPVPESDFGNIFVKEWNVYKDEREKIDSLSYNYVITTYTPEPCTIPALSFILEENGSTDTVTTEEIPLHILSVITGDTVDLIGLKPPLAAGKAPKWWLWLLGTIGVLAAVIFGSIYLIKKLRKTPPPPPPVPPYEEAIEALRSLGVKKYLQKGLVREYVFELSEIFKRYIGRRFDCNAVEFTTEEMIAWTGAFSLDIKLRASIEWFFRTTDPVKFARLIPDSAIIERFEREVRDFLELTKPLAESRENEEENDTVSGPQSDRTDTPSEQKENT